MYDSSNRVVRQNATLATNGVIPIFETFDYTVPNQTTTKDALGNPTVYTFSGSFITSIRDPLGNMISQTWYSSTNPATGAYNQALQSKTDKRGLVSTYSYDSNGNLTQTVISGNLTGTSGTQQAVVTESYNNLNQPLTIVDASGITTAYSYGDPNYPYQPTQITYSASGVVTRTDTVTYAVAGTTTAIPFAAGLIGRKVNAVGPNQSAMNYFYSLAGFLNQETQETGTGDQDVTTSYTYTNRGELASITDGDGRSTAYTYDAMSRPLTKSVADENGTILATWTTSYNGSGQVIKVVGPRANPANVEQWTYDDGGWMIQNISSTILAQKNGAGVALGSPTISQYSVDLDGNVTAFTDPLGNVTQSIYDGNNQLLKRTVAGLKTETFQYESGGNVASYTNPLGGVTLKSYTSTGKITTQQNPDGSTQSWNYYPDGRLQKEVLRNGCYWLVTYNDVALTVTKTLTAPDGTNIATKSEAYDPLGNLVGTTDVDGNTFTNTFDGLNRVKTATGPQTVAGSAQRFTTYFYGASEKTVIAQNALDESTITTSDALSRALLVQVKDANGSAVRTTSYVYSADNNSSTVTSGTGSTAISSTVYSDYAGQPLLTVYGDGAFAYNVYDLDGNMLASTDRLGQTSVYTYNALNQRTSQTLPDGTLTNFTYDTAGDLLTRAMAGGSLDLQQTFDSAGRKLTEALVSGGASTRQFSYAYNPSTGLLQTTTAPRSTATVTYDDFLRPQKVTTVGSLAETNTTTSYAYDNRGLATSISQSSINNAAGPATQVSRTYDGYGNVLSDTDTLGGQTVSNVSQTWDAAGRRASLNEASSSLQSPLFSYQHRADGLLTQTSANNQNYSFGYADNGLLISRTSPFRSLSIDLRDSAGRILQQTTTASGTPLMVEDMTWRANSTLNTYAVARNGMGAWNESRTYSYNSRGQLVSEGFSPAAGVSSAVAYTFDGNNPGLGVRTDAKVGSGAPSQWEESAAATNSFAQVTQDLVPNSSSIVQANGVALGADHVNILVDGSSQGLATFPGWRDPVGAWSISLNLAAGIHTLTANAVHPSGLYTATSSSTFTVSGTPGGVVVNAFDADGNVTSRTWPNGLSQALTWDAFGRLVKVSQRNSSGNGYDWMAAYDGLGRRLQTNQQPVISGAQSGAPTVTTSTYDPQVEFLEIGVALNGTKAWKVYGPDLNGRFGGLQGTGGLEATILDTGGTTQGVINDQFGNGVASVTGGAATWFATRVGAYGPLPGTQAATLTDITQLAAATAWRGRRIDPTGFYDLGARYYEPTSGRFLSADPMGQAASPSLYDFAGGDPVNSFDPDGRCPNTPNPTPPPTSTTTPTAPVNPGPNGQNPSDPQNSSQNPAPPVGGIVGQAIANGSQGMSLADYQALAAQLGLNGFTSNLSENQQLYYGQTIADILQQQGQGKDMSQQWAQVVEEVPGAIVDSNNNTASDSADAARNSFLATINGPTALGVLAVGAIKTANAMMPELDSASLQSTLASNGWTTVASGQSSNGAYVVMQNGSTTVTFYTSTSGGGVPSAEVQVNGVSTLKMRLGSSGTAPEVVPGPNANGNSSP
jgi:RHS repeat-associated protein